MHQDIQTICEALDRLADAVVTAFPHQTDQLFSDYWTWQVPSMTRRDLSLVVRSIADDLRLADPESYPDSFKSLILNVPARIAFLQATTLPTAYAGNPQAFPAFLDTLRNIRENLMPAVGWTPVPAKASMPVNLVRRVSAAKGRLEELESAIPELAGKVTAINSAHLVAENLEVDLQALAEAKEAIERTAKETDLNSAKVELSASQSATVLETMQKRAESTLDDVQRKTEAALEEAEKKAKSAMDKLEKYEETAQKLIAQCEAAYHITTTKGLAGAFDQRAASLAWSMRGWVAGLAAALIAGSLIGASRLSTLAAVLTEATPNWPAIVSHIVLSVLGVGAPLWFSWLATKQIGQRFRLSEDYAFKASVAKAYEGYRKEAAVLDPEFQATLFRSALTRLDEAPLRLVEAEQHASPWAEILNSDAVKNALKIAPDLPMRMMSLVNDTIQQAKNATVEAAKVLEAAKSTVIPDETKKEE
ncbi:hypothetical protein [Janthinobacterium lividum]|uniref:hypothetical protein n=1 Tax=Janthinobacterium lividum TaxID=29581 RepID=UPI000451E931|nr:hypothetical protein [Janthinobacterium lividum]EZP37486.1 hypothetical protein BW37_03739 [Janthinobacterium lividum]